MSTADRRTSRFSSAFQRKHWILTYGFAVASTAAALVITRYLESATSLHAPFLFYFPAVLLVAFLAGRGPGIFASLLGALGTSFFFLEPRNSFRVVDAGGVFLPAIACCIGVFLTLLVCSRARADQALLESEDRYRDLVEHSADLVCTHDLEGRLLTVNPAPARTLGYEVSELLKMPMRELVAPEYRGEFDGYMERIQKNGTDRGLLCVLSRSGERRIWEYNNTLRVEGVPRPVVRGIARDVTDERRAKWELDKSEQRYRLLFEKSVAAVLITGTDGVVIDCNEAWARMVGFADTSQVRGQNIVQFYASSLSQAEVLADLKRSGVFHNREFEMRRLDGTVIWVSMNSALIAGQKDETLVQSTVVDVTTRKLAEAALSANEEQLRLFVEHAPAALAMFDRNMRYLRASHRWRSDYALGEHDLAGLSHYEIFPEIPDRWKEVHRRALGGEVLHGDEPFQRVNGTVQWVRWEVRPWHDRQGEIGGIVIFSEDTTAERESEQALRKSEEHFRILVEQASDGIFVGDARGRYIDVNTAGAEMLGYTRDELLQLSIADVIVAEEIDRIAPEVARFAGGHIARSEWTFKRKDGSCFPGEVAGRRLPDGRLQAILRDMTERKQAEAVLRASEQMERARAKDLQTILDTLPIPVLIARDVECREITTNRAGSDYFMLPEGSNISLSAPIEERPRFRCVQDGTDIPAEQLPMQRAARGETVRDFSAKMILPDGTEKYELGNAEPLLDEQGNICGAVAAAIDITNRIRAEEALRYSDQRFRVALTNTPIAVFNQDRDLRYTWIYNPHLYWQEDVIGKTDEEILGAKKSARLNELKRYVLEKGVSRRDEVVIPHNGKSYAFDLTVEPLFDRSGNIVGITGASMDIARLREIADALQDAKEKLSREKSYLENQIQTELGFAEIIGQSASLQEVLAKTKVVAPTDSTVLLLGETGTGKELIARSVHGVSHRRDQNFIKLNCAAVPSGLLESELFGHEKGAFTGAVSQKVGRLELADRGTLFLDEVGELPLELQPKLLRVLQDREFERLGGIKTLHVDVRIVAATNRDLRQDVVDRKFREDLFYRLNVFPIQMPPLRERREDIPMLVEHFVRKHAAKMGKHIHDIPEETMGVLQRWSWPGNVRELENLLERMVILTKGSKLAPPPAELTDQEDLFEDSLTEMEREHIIRVLRETNGVVAGTEGAATRLGLKRTTLQSMLKRFGIEPRDYRRGNGSMWRQ